MNIENLEKKGYKSYESSLYRNSKNYQKRFSDEKGIKYFIDFHLYDSGIEVVTQFTHKNGTTENIEIFYIREYSISDIENIIEKRFTDGDFEYYELGA